MLVISKEEGWIGFRLNILGVRVWGNNTCNLVARTGTEWMILGPARDLPLEVPRDAEELSNAAHDPLLITAYQYMETYPDADLAALLSKTKDFDTVMNG